jgi:FtsZ-interacting cell division protein ZipA
MESIVAICGAIVAITSIIVGLWRRFSRIAKYKREQADEAKKKLDSAHANQDKSDLLDAWDGINRVR